MIRLVLLDEVPPTVAIEEPLEDLVRAEELYAVVLTSLWVIVREIEPVGVAPTVGRIDTEDIDIL